MIAISPFYQKKGVKVVVFLPPIQSETRIISLSIVDQKVMGHFSGKGKKRAKRKRVALFSNGLNTVEEGLQC